MNTKQPFDTQETHFNCSLEAVSIQMRSVEMTSLGEVKGMSSEGSWTLCTNSNEGRALESLKGKDENTDLGENMCKSVKVLKRTDLPFIGYGSLSNPER